MNLAPAVPRKVIVSLDGFLSAIANVTIGHGCIFYNRVTPFDASVVVD